MAGISNIFEIGRVGIQAHQQGLATTSHNISNINTKGFSRQEVVLGTAPPANGVESSGVQVQAIRQNVDAFLEKQVTDLREDVGRLTARHNFLTQVDALFTETASSGIGFETTEFFNAVRDLAVAPENAVQRTVLLGKANKLTDQMNRAATLFDQIRRDADGEIGRHISTINGFATEIASLNDSIFRAEANGQSALDLRDTRQVVLNDLAELVDIEVIDATDGLTINIGGHLLVTGNHANSLSQVPDADNPPVNDVAVVRSDGTTVAITSQIGDGALKGLLTLRDGDIGEFQDRLDRFAAVLVNEFNQQHEAGFGLDGTTNNAFFTALSPEAPVANDGNAGGAVGTSVTVSDPTALTFDTYQVVFTSATAFNVVDTTTGSNVITGGAYTSGADIIFDGLTVVITDNTGVPAVDDIFTVDAHSGAALDFSVNLTDTDKIAASSTAAGVPGNNINALALVDIHTTRQGTLGNITLNDYHTVTIGNVGSTAREVSTSLIGKEAETEQVQALRESVSGVSLDEELTNLLSFQRAFEASARLITVADELLQTVISLGR